MTLVNSSLLMLILCIAVWCDIASHRIPNKLIIFGMLTGITLAACHALYGNSYAVALDSIAAFFIGIFLLFIPFAFGGIGAGDVKLLGVIGLFVGTKSLITIAALSFIIGALISFGLIIHARIMKFHTPSNVIMSFFNGFHTRQLISREEGAMRLPFALPMGIATLMLLIMQWGTLC